MTSATASSPSLLRQYLVLTKPRVTQLAVFCAVIGMFLATPALGWAAVADSVPAEAWLLVDHWLIAVGG